MVDENEELKIDLKYRPINIEPGRVALRPSETSINKTDVQF